MRKMYPFLYPSPVPMPIEYLTRPCYAIGWQQCPESLYRIREGF